MKNLNMTVVNLHFQEMSQCWLLNWSSSLA